MKRVVLTGTKDGSSTIFSLPEQSVGGGLTLFVQGNHLLHEVAKNPVPGEYVKLSASQVQLGLAPNATDPVYAFITTTLASGMEEVALTGERNGTNVTFTVPAAAPAGSHFLVFLASNILEETAAVPTVGQIRIVGTTFTFGLAPNAGDDLVAYRETAGPVLMRKLTQQSSASGSGTTTVSLSTEEGYEPVLLVVYGGLRIAETTETLTPTRYSITWSSVSFQIKFGLLPKAADHVDIYLLGFAEIGVREDINPTLLNFRQLQRRLLVLMNSQIDVGEAQMVLDERWRNLQQASLFSVTKVNRRLETRAPKTGGTVTLTNGLDLVIGSGTAFSAGDVGLSIQLDQIYEIANVDTTNQYLYLSTRYAGPSGSNKPYRIVKRFYLLAPDVWRVLTLTGKRFRLVECTQAALNAIDPGRSVSGEPYRYAYSGPTTGGVERIELWPVPDNRYLMHGVGLTRSTLTDPAQIIGDLSNLILNGGAAMACPIIANKKAAEEKLQAASFWLGQASYWEGQYQALLKDFKRQDRKRFGENMWDEGFFDYQGHPSYDFPVAAIDGSGSDPDDMGFGFGGFGETPFGT